MKISCSWPHCVPSAWGLLVTLEVWDNKELSWHPCMCHTEACGSWCSGEHKTDQQPTGWGWTLLSFSAPYLQRLVRRGRRSIWPLWRLPVRLGSSLITKLVSLSQNWLALHRCLLWLTTLLPPHLLACKCTPSKAFTQKGFSSLFQGTQAKKGVTTIIDSVPLLFVILLHSYYSHQYIM